MQPAFAHLRRVTILGMMLCGLCLCEKVQPHCGKFVAVDAAQKVGCGWETPDHPLVVPAARGEVAHFQAILGLTNIGGSTNISVSVDGLKNVDMNTTLHKVEYVYVNNTYNNSKLPGLFPDPLLPLRENRVKVPVVSPSECVLAVLISITVPENVAAGTYRGFVQLHDYADCNKSGSIFADWTLRVFNFTLPHRTQLTGAQFGLKGIEAYTPSPPLRMDLIQTAMSFFRALADAGVNSLVWAELSSLPFMPEWSFNDKYLNTLNYNTTLFDEFWPRVLNMGFLYFKMPIVHRISSTVRHQLPSNASFVFRTDADGDVTVPIFNSPPMGDTASLNPTFARAYTLLLTKCLSHLEARGWDQGSWVQVIDEPDWMNKETLSNILLLMRFYKKVSPKIKLFQTRFPVGSWSGTGCAPQAVLDSSDYADPVTPEMQPLLKLVDWWCPHVCQWHSNPSVRQKIISVASERPRTLITIYDNGVPIIFLSSLRARLQAWQVWNTPLNGTLSWYSVNSWAGSLREPELSPWLQPALPGLPAGFGFELYPPKPSTTPLGGWEPVTSLRWLMLGVGTAEVEYFSLLKRLSNGADPALKAIANCSWALPSSWRSRKIWIDEGYTTEPRQVLEAKLRVGNAIERWLA